MTAQLGGIGKVTIDPVRVAREITGPNGLVIRQIVRDADLVVREAKRLVGYSDNRGPDYQHIRDTIVKRIGLYRGDVSVFVGTPHPRALIHHEGTKPHIIRARRKPTLAFYWPRVGRWVYPRMVHHPGTKPNRFLTNALRALNGRYR